jgi:hypothetical protein
MIGPKPAPFPATLEVMAFAVIVWGGTFVLVGELMMGPMPAPLPATLVVIAFAVIGCGGTSVIVIEFTIGLKPAPLLATLPTTVVEARSITPKEGIGETEAGIRVW